MKQTYEKAAAEVIAFTNSDIVTVSNCYPGTNTGWIEVTKKSDFQDN